MNKNQKGFAVTAVLLFLIIVILVVAGWFVWRQSNNKSLEFIDSFEACAAAGNPIIEMYPEQCMANGKTFTNMERIAQDPPRTITQGVKGIITIRSGDCMPTVAPYGNSCSVKPYNAPSEVIIKKPIDLNNKENKELVKKIDITQGYFEAELQPGLYNMYVLYEGQEYCNSFGGLQRGEDCEFTVEEGQVTSYTLEINNAVD